MSALAFDVTKARAACVTEVTRVVHETGEPVGEDLYTPIRAAMLAGGAPPSATPDWNALPQYLRDGFEEAAAATMRATEALGAFMKRQAE